MVLCRWFWLFAAVAVAACSSSLDESSAGADIASDVSTVSDASSPNSESTGDGGRIEPSERFSPAEVSPFGYRWVSISLEGTGLSASDVA